MHGEQAQVLAQVAVSDQVPGAAIAKQALRIDSALGGLVLKLPKNRLLQLSGCVEEQDEALTQQSVRFAARSDAMETLTSEQKQALDEYIRYLEKSDEALEG